MCDTHRSVTLGCPVYGGRPGSAPKAKLARRNGVADSLSSAHTCSSRTSQRPGADFGTEQSDPHSSVTPLLWLHTDFVLAQTAVSTHARPWQVCARGAAKSELQREVGRVFVRGELHCFEAPQLSIQLLMSSHLHELSMRLAPSMHKFPWRR
jgi:hypothetical protein